jgi:hypothetical protein
VLQSLGTETDTLLPVENMKIMKHDTVKRVAF